MDIVAYKYMFMWILINFIFALIIIVLLFEINFAEINKTVILSCLLAALSPELLTNVKFKLGRSEESVIDLSAYKAKALDVISNQLKGAAVRRQKQQLLALNHYGVIHRNKAIK